MEEALTRALADVRSSDQGVQNSAYKAVMEATDVPIAWAYELWDRVVADLGDVDNHVRAIAAQLLCNLAKSDPERRITRDFPALLEVTRDSRFVRRAIACSRFGRSVPSVGLRWRRSGRGWCGASLSAGRRRAGP